MKIIENYYDGIIGFNYLIEDETGTYGVDFRDDDLSDDYCTCLIDPETKTPIADTTSTKSWTEFYQRGWSKTELVSGHREAWNLPTGGEAEEKFWGEKVAPEEFAAIRWILGLEVTELASRLDVNERTVRRYENGETAIPNKIIERMRGWLNRFIDSQDEAVSLLRHGEPEISIGKTPQLKAFGRIQYLLATMEGLEPEIVS